MAKAKLRKFRPFSKLPLEIRLKIWRFALPIFPISRAARNRIPMTVGEISSSVVQDYVFSAVDPSLLKISQIHHAPRVLSPISQVCHEARQESLFFLKKLLSAAPKMEKSIIWLNSMDIGGGLHVLQHHGINLTSIQHLLLSRFRPLDNHFRWLRGNYDDLKDLFSKLPDLKKLNIVVPDMSDISPHITNNIYTRSYVRSVKRFFAKIHGRKDIHVEFWEEENGEPPHRSVHGNFVRLRKIRGARLR